MGTIHVRHRTVGMLVWRSTKGFCLAQMLRGVSVFGLGVAAAAGLLSHVWGGEVNMQYSCPVGGVGMLQGGMRRLTSA
eukprot:3583938-Prymnesium_polylepis.1